MNFNNLAPDANILLDSFFTTNNNYYTGDGLWEGLLIISLLLFIIFLSYWVFKNSDEQQESIRVIVSPRAEKNFQRFRKFCKNTRLGIPLKKWNTFQEYMDFIHQENLKSINNNNGKSSKEAKKEQLKIKIFTILIITFLSFISLYQINKMVEIPSHISIKDNSTAIIHQNFTKNKIIFKQNIKEIHISQRSKTIQNTKKTSHQKYYCELRIELNSGVSILFEISSIEGNFSQCITST